MALLSEMEQRTHALIYGPQSTPEQRLEYLDAYGCTKPTSDAIKAISKMAGRVIEIGAGRGHWAAALRSIGVDVLAVDDFSDDPGNDPKAAPVTAVVRGDHGLVKENRDRSLLLVYPPSTPLALDSLRVYEGRWLFYVGEPKGGANGTDAFFEELRRRWCLRRVVEVEPFEGGGEKLWILERM
jgi:hypothetical protein